MIAARRDLYPHLGARDWAEREEIRAGLVVTGCHVRI